MEFVLVPGAWAGGWIWDEVAKSLRDRGHNVHQLTLSGLNEQSETCEIGLSTHIEDVESYIIRHGLESIVLVGHSYSGIIVGQVATRGRVSIRHTIFIEAFLPVSGQSLLDVSGLSIDEEERAILENEGMWPAPSRAELATQPRLNDADINLLCAKQRPHPGKTVTDAVKLESPLVDIPATFIAHEGWLSFSREHDLLATLKSSGSWRFKNIEGGHWPMLTIPQKLAELIHSCVA
ncbi:alpha/beta hydrolase [Microbulbifer elongatus]|uniref:Alpha/beta hydrolase n=1 Tax=Microbulbifer elongatus TaxID=86173 RepID=A0ABT1P2L5_9GAMM|nr:alpha/beta hydrolase [Microbulbifer elongatus]MCQ3829261.1 alpha/beta hydrolase [Microbulbifer elongatus]